MQKIKKMRRIILRQGIWLNKSKYLFLILLTIVVFILIKSESSFVTYKNPLTPDSTLYTGLADNLVAGKGYFDTIRKDDVLPPIGHPLLLAFTFKFGLKSFSTLLFIILGVVSMLATVYLVTKNNLVVIIMISVLIILLKNIGFYDFGTESSGFFVSGLLLLSLALIHKNPRRILPFCALGTAIALHILVRPVLLQLVIILSLILLILNTFKYFREKRFHIEDPLLKWSLPFLISSFIILFVWVTSIIRYGDSRYVRGTYAAMNLYLSNNPYLPTDQGYNSTNFAKYFPKDEQDLVLQNPDGWKNRENRLFKKAINYILSNPKRAMSAWKWRLQRYMAEDYCYPQPLGIYKIMAFTLLPFMIIRSIRFFAILRKKGLNKNWIPIGIFIGLLYYFQLSLSILFSWTDTRYLLYHLPFLVVAFSIILYEIVIGYTLQDCTI